MSDSDLPPPKGSTSGPSASQADPAPGEAQTPLSSPAPPPRPPPPASVESPTARGSVGGTILRIVGLFIAIGLGLASGALIFLWQSGTFEAEGENDALGATILAAFALTAVTAFSLLIGVVIAAVAGMHAAHTLLGRGRAVLAAAVGSALGHLAMVVVLAVFMLGAFRVMGGSGGLSPSPSPSPADSPPDSQTAQELQVCREMFGEDAAICELEPETELEIPTPEEVAEPEPTSAVSPRTFIRLAMGMIPASIVGLVSAALLWTKNRRTM